MPKAVTLLSGGLDSTTLAYHLKAEGYDLICLSFDYGQRHSKEIDAARMVAKALGADHSIVLLEAVKIEDTSTTTIVSQDGLGSILGDSVLVNEAKDVPDGHYADENMKQTVVPNRNAIMLSIAYGVALAHKADIVAFAAHAGDHTIYPDCRPEFVATLGTAFVVGAKWEANDRVPELIGPFLEKDKAWIAKQAFDLKVPVEMTWSCYKGGDIHCGTCGTCYERREAFKLANVPDTTTYLDNTTEFEAPEA